MIIDYSNINELRLPAFKGGEGEMLTRMFTDENMKIGMSRLAPGSSIGYHQHSGTSETIWILRGEGHCLYDGTEEKVSAGTMHYCPEGHSHCLVNDSKTEDLVFINIVPRHETKE